MLTWYSRTLKGGIVVSISLHVGILLACAHFQDNTDAQYNYAGFSLELESFSKEADASGLLVLRLKLANPTEKDLILNLAKGANEPLVEILILDPKGKSWESVYLGPALTPKAYSHTVRPGQYLTEFQILSLRIFKGQLSPANDVEEGRWTLQARLGRTLMSNKTTVEVRKTAGVSQQDRGILSSPALHALACGEFPKDEAEINSVTLNIQTCARSFQKSAAAFLISQYLARPVREPKGDVAAFRLIASEESPIELKRRILMQSAAEHYEKREFDEAENLLRQIPREDGNLRQIGLDKLLEKIQHARKSR